MISSPSQVDTYWSVFLPPLRNYKLEPETTGYLYNLKKPAISLFENSPLRLMFSNKLMQAKLEINIGLEHLYNVPGFNCFCWEDFRNQVLQRRDEKAIVDLTVIAVLCLDVKAKTNG